ncbi:MAG: hypothetical protein ACR2NZ_02940 [Rubripirellula sp.]
MNPTTFTTIVRRRNAFTLLELITAMLASTALVVALAATMTISTQLMEVPPADEATWQDHRLSDRIASDLRFATQIREETDGFTITRPNADDGSPQTVTYQSGVDGLTRQVDGGSVFQLDADEAKSELIVDGYSAPTDPTPDTYVRIRSVSSVAPDSLSTNVTVDIPSGVRAGDLVLLCISGRYLSSLSASGGGWRVLSWDSVSDLHLIVGYKTYDDSWDSNITISTSSSSAMAVALVAIEQVNTDTPFPWATTRRGYASASSSSSFPLVRESADLDERQMNLQVFAAQGDPWQDGAMGIPGFTEVFQTTALSGYSSYRNTLSVATRNGLTPTMSSEARTNHLSSGYWLQSSATVELAP